ncbi:cytochrome P450 monooxygenase pc-1 [Mycena crocata]|nr:cytochrome P450 monooxygenase pc-1 [Mycena crocata]
MLSPGVAFLLRSSPILAIPLAVLAGVPAICEPLDLALPTWVVVLLAVASLPLYAICRVTFQDLRDKRAASAAGARLVPKVKGRSFGNIDILKMMRHNRAVGYVADGLNEAVADLGPIVNFRVLWQDTILTTSPDHIKLILATNFNNYIKGDKFKYNMNSVLGTGVFNSDGDRWKYHRSLTKPFFSRDRVSDFDIFDRHADEVISLLKQRTNAGYAVDFQDLIGRFTMDSASEFLFNMCVDSLKDDLPYAHNVAFPPPQSKLREGQAAIKFMDAFGAAMLRISQRQVLGRIWPMFEIFGDQTADAMKVINDYLEPVIHAALEKRLAKPKEKTDENEEESSLLDDMLNTTSDLQLLKDEMVNLLVAGRDTTMHTITNVMYFFTMYPGVCERARQEVLALVGPDRRPTYDDIKDMKYLRAVLNESMRLYPSVPFNVRENIDETILPSPDPNAAPIYVPAGSKVSYSVFMMHRRKDLWGPDAEEFSPARFLDERLKKYLLKNPSQFLPFNAGPRICLGQQFAYNEMSFVLIRLLQAFSSFSLDEDALAPEGRPPVEWASAPGRKGIDKFRPSLHISMSVVDGLWIRAQEAENI